MAGTLPGYHLLVVIVVACISSPIKSLEQALAGNPVELICAQYNFGHHDSSQLLIKSYFANEKLVPLLCPW